MKYSFIPLRHLLLCLLLTGTMVSNAQKLQFEVSREEQVNELSRYNLIGRIHTIVAEDSAYYYINRTIPPPGIKVDQINKKTHSPLAIKELPAAGFKTIHNTYFYGIYKSPTGFVAFMSTNEKEESFVTCY